MGYINTIRDLEAQTYGMGGAFGGNDILKQAGVVQGIHSGHDASTGAAASGVTAISSTTGLYNVLYGQKVWSMLNREVNALSMISKRPYTSSGWRVLKSRPFGGSGNTLAEAIINDTDTDATIGSDTPAASNIGGVPENAGLSTAADGLGAMAPTYAQLFMSPKTVAHQFDFSELAMEMAKIDDGIGDIRAQMREDMGIAHAEAQNMMLLMPLEHYGETTDQSTGHLINIERNYTSLNKIVSSRAEILAIDGGVIATDTASATKALAEIYGDERHTAASFLDSEVDFGSGYAATDVRSLTLTLLNSMIRRLRVAGGSPKVILTGYDTIQTIADLLQSQERFMDRKEIVPTVNGVRGVKGAEVGFRVATYYDIPLIPCKDMASTGNATSKTSDLLFLDTDHIWLAVMKPTQYFEDGISNGNPFGVGRLGNQALYRTIGEIGCSFFKGQGKITNIQ
tara:strand:- start:1092 stop:2453 length:1362 start_codon:yes stop_codon:yes gene_type:complete